MAKDDYHVIVCKILKYLYACLKAGENAENEKLMEIIGDLPARYAEYIVDTLHQEGYVAGAYPETDNGEEKPRLTSATMITPKGIEYLNNNKYNGHYTKFLNHH